MGCFFVGNIANCPEVYADEDQAKAVGDAVREFAKHHTVYITDKRLSEYMMAAVGGSFVGVRVWALVKKFWPKPQPRPARPVLVMDQPQQAAPDVPGAPRQAPPQQPGPPSREVAPSSLDPLNAAGDLED